MADRLKRCQYTDRIGEVQWTGSESIERMNRGKIIILAILTAAIAVSGYGIWYRHQQMHRVLDSLSPRVAQLIALAPHVELLELSTGGDRTAEEENAILIQKQSRSVTARKLVGESKGFSNLRTDLVRDSSYSWDKPAPSVDDKSANWKYIVIFRDGTDETRLAFDTDGCQLMLLSDGPILSIGPICEPTAAFFLEQFPPPKSAELKAP